MLNRERGALPLYRQLEIIIKDSIDNGEYSAGDILPAESDSMKLDEISRITVRQALQNLASIGYVQGMPGKGTVVTKKKIEENLRGIKSFSDEMREHGIEMETTECEVSRILPPPQIAMQLGISEKEECLRIVRTRAAEGSPIVYSTTYIPSSRNLPDDPSCYKDSLYEFLSRTYGIVIKEATDILEAALADSATAKALGINEGEAVFKRTRKSLDQNSKLMGISISFYPGTRYSYSIDL